MKLRFVLLTSAFGLALPTFACTRTPERETNTAILAGPDAGPTTAMRQNIPAQQPVREVPAVPIDPTEDETDRDETAAIGDKKLGDQDTARNDIKQDQMGRDEIDTDETIAKADKDLPASRDRQFGTASLKGPKASGALTLRHRGGRSEALIDLRDVPSGDYQVQIFQGGDCGALSQMETPYAGAPGVAGEGKVGTPGPKTTLALWQDLGVVNIGSDGKAIVPVKVVDVDGTRFDKHVVVVYSKAPAGKSGMTACGPLKAEILDNTEG